MWSQNQFYICETYIHLVIKAHTYDPWASLWFWKQPYEVVCLSENWTAQKFLFETNEFNGNGLSGWVVLQDIGQEMFFFCE